MADGPGGHRDGPQPFQPPSPPPKKSVRYGVTASRRRFLCPSLLLPGAVIDDRPVPLSARKSVSMRWST